MAARRIVFLGAEHTAKLRPGGLFLASTRDYDALVRERAPATLPLVLDGPDGRRVVFQVWDWHADGRAYRLHQFILRDTAAGWQTGHYTTEYRADVVQGYYTSLLHRTASATEVASWVNTGHDLHTIRMDVESSPEFFTNG